MPRRPETALEAAGEGVARLENIMAEGLSQWPGSSDDAEGIEVWSALLAQADEAAGEVVRKLAALRAEFERVRDGEVMS